MDKATGAYEPFIQIPPGLDCRGTCPEPARHKFEVFNFVIYSALPAYLAALDEHAKIRRVTA